MSKGHYLYNLPFLIFMVLSLMELLGRLMLWPYINITKPLLMPALIFWFLTSVKSKRSKIILLTVSALVFSWIGDIALMYEEPEHYFIIGLASFLIAHFCYILVFRNASSPTLTPLKLKFIAAIFIGCYAAFLLVVLLPASGGLWPSVLIYGLVISLMLLFSVSRRGLVDKNQYYYGVFGALLFVISDSILAINKFYLTIPQSSFFIMLTYLTGQWLIALSVARYCQGSISSKP